METWPEFVRDVEVEERQSCLSGSRVPGLTGWETVVFELEDVQGSDFSTAAMAP
jgi:hypothetical protein